MNENKLKFIFFSSYAILIAIAWFNSNRHSPQKEIQNPTHITGKDNLLPYKSIPNQLIISNKESGVFFGKCPNYPNAYIGKSAKEDGHILVIGSSGSGKTTAIANRTLVQWQGSIFTIIIKGQSDKYIRKLQQKGRKVLIFEPGKGELNTLRYDPFLTLEYHPDNLIGLVKDIAEMLMPLSPNIQEPVWIIGAQNFLIGAIITCYRLGYSFVETLNTILTTNIPDMIEIIEEANITDAMPFVSKLKDLGNKTLHSIGFEISKLAKLWEPEILTAFTPSKEQELLDWEELNTAKEPLNIALIIPEAKLGQWGPLLTLMIEQLFLSLTNRPEQTNDKENLPPLLIMVDEFVRLGKISAIVNGMNTLRSRGITIMLLLQSLTNLDEIYGENVRKIIIENCTYKAILQLAEPTSQKYFSDLSGSTTTTETTTGCNSSSNFSLLNGQLSGLNIGKGNSISHSPRRRPLIYPHAFLGLKDIVCITPYGTFQVKKESTRF